MNCPVCKDASLVMAERQGVEIDYCTQCRGIWLDRGELDKILERYATAGEQEPGGYEREREYRRHGQDYEHREYRGHGRKRRGGLWDLFDFD